MSANEVHVWRARLDCELDSLGPLEATLSADEVARADRFVFKADRTRFVMARGTLRELLGRYLGLLPKRIQLSYGQHGKPAIDTRAISTPLEFNLSHSDGLAVYAFSDGRKVGIDVERFRPELAKDEIAKRYFSKNEIAEFNLLPLELRTEGFFLCWTRKEAYIKAKGDGLHIPLDSFDVSLTPGEPAMLSTCDEVDWGINSFLPAHDSTKDFAAALVVDGKRHRTSFFGFAEKDSRSDMQTKAK